MYRCFKQLHLISRNLSWLRGSHSTWHKVSYYFYIFASYLRLFLRDVKVINYLGCNLYYDNLATPLSLMYYPYEIGEKILKNTEIPINSLLDIGANIGQFSITFNRISPNTIIDSLEPNPSVFNTLESNTRDIANIKIYDYGVGPQKSQILYYSATQSAIGSLLRANSSTRNRSDIQEVHIKNTQDVYKLTGRKDYDLVKIDVEGYEYNVINNLKGIKTKYLFIEMSGAKRDKDAISSMVLMEIQNVLGEYDIINTSEANINSMNFDLLLKFR